MIRKCAELQSFGFIALAKALKLTLVRKVDIIWFLPGTHPILHVEKIALRN